MTPAEAATSLLILTGRVHPAASSLEAARRIAHGRVDWNFFLKAAAREAVGPLVALHLRDLPFPKAVSAELLSLRRATSVRHIRAGALVGPILEAARKQALDVLVTKGLRLAETLYPEPGLRPFLDVDLMIRPDAWPAFRRLLESRGFRPRSEADAVTTAAYLRDPWVLSPVFRSGAVDVEVHMNPLGLHMPLRDESRFWEAAVSESWSGTRARVQSWEYEFCGLAVHAQQHSYERLSWLVDLAEIVSLRCLDWEAAAGIARREGIGQAVRCGLRRVESLWPGTVGPGLLRRFPLTPWESLGHRYFWPESAVWRRGPFSPAPYYTPSLFAMLRRRRPVLAARSLARILFPPRDWAAGHSARRGWPGRLSLYGRRIGRPPVALAKRLFRID